MVDLKNDPKTAPLAGPSPARQPGADLNADLSKVKLPNPIDLGVDMILEGPDAFRSLHFAESVAKKFGKCTAESVPKKFGKCTIGSVTMTVATVGKV